MSQPPAARSPGGANLPGHWAGMGNVVVMCQGNPFFHIQAAGIQDKKLDLDQQAPLLQEMAHILAAGLGQANMLGANGFHALIAPLSLRPEGLLRDDPFGSPLGVPASLAWDAEQRAREFAALDGFMRSLDQQIGGPVAHLTDGQQRLDVYELLLQKGNLALWRFRQSALSLFAEQASLYALAEPQAQPALQAFQAAARGNPDVLRAWVLYHKYRAQQPALIDQAAFALLSQGRWQETLNSWAAQQRLTDDQAQAERHYLNAIGTAYDGQATQRAAREAEWYFSEALRRQPDHSVALVNLAALLSESALLAYIETGSADRARLQQARTLFQQAHAALDQRPDREGRIALAQCLLYEATSLPTDAHLEAVPWAAAQAQQMRAALGQDIPAALRLDLAQRNLARRDPAFIDRQKIEQARDILIGAGAMAGLIALAEHWLSAQEHMAHLIGEGLKAGPAQHPLLHHPGQSGGNPAGPANPPHPPAPAPQPSAEPGGNGWGGGGQGGGGQGGQGTAPPEPGKKVAHAAQRKFLATTQGKIILGLLAAIVVVTGVTAAIAFAQKRPPPQATITPTPTSSPTPTPTAIQQTPVGTITEFAILTPNSAPYGIVVGPDGNLWFTESGLATDRAQSSNLGRITLNGVINEYPIPTKANSPEGIAAGPDGNLWFTDPTGNSIGSSTPDGSSIQEFSISDVPAGPASITAGPNNLLYFTETRTDAIGFITPDGKVGTFVALAAKSTPFGLALGPDGNLWFTEQGADQIGQVTPDGKLTEFPVKTSGSGLSLITAGPDGNMWFTETFANQIGFITPDGQVAEFPLPTPNSQPFGIAAGPDGNLWFTESGTDQIGRITPQGQITEFPLPARSRPLEITTGPDGNMWFTEYNGNKIGRITTGAGKGT